MLIAPVLTSTLVPSAKQLLRTKGMLIDIEKSAKRLWGIEHAPTFQVMEVSRLVEHVGKPYENNVFIVFNGSS